MKLLPPIAVEAPTFVRPNVPGIVAPSPCTTALSLEEAFAEPSELVPVTLTRTVRPTSDGSST